MNNAIKLPEDLMNETEFWDIVEKCNWKGMCTVHHGYDIVQKGLISILSEKQANKFLKTASYFRHELYPVLNCIKGMGDDGFGDFLCHIIGMGKEEYYKCLNSSEYAKETYSKCYEENFFYCIPNPSDYIVCSPNYDGYFKRADRIYRAFVRCEEKNLLHDHVFPVDLIGEIHFLYASFKLFNQNHDYTIFKNGGVTMIKYAKNISEYIKKNPAKLPHALFMSNDEFWEFCEPESDTKPMPDDWNDYGTQILRDSWIIKSIVNEIMEKRPEVA